MEIWKKLETDEYKSFRHRDCLKEECGSCKYRYYCGGCRARALSYFNDLSAPDIGCIHNIKAWMEKVNSLKLKQETAQQIV